MNASDLWACAVKGAQWLTAQQEPDGRWRPLRAPCVDAYYKGAWALSLMGCPTQAHRCLDYSVRHLLQPNGDLTPRRHFWHREIHHLYSNAYFVLGGVRTGRYDVLQPTLRFILSQQQPASGGFSSSPSVGDAAAPCDSMSTAACGLAALAAGRLDVASSAARWLANLAKEQPEPDTALYTTTDAEGRLVTTYASADAPWRVVRTDQPNQTWYAIGLPFAFLVKAAQATGQRSWLALAGWFYDLQERCVDAWGGPSSGKAGWGCAELYRMTGKARYRDIALQVGSFIAQNQSPDGAWNSNFGQPVEETHVWVPQDFDATAEFTLWLGEIASNVLARDGAG
jgi:hypothetical protein